MGLAITEDTKVKRMANHAQDFEAAFWGDCSNTFHEERKHYTYASLMGIKRQHWGFVVPQGTRILDIGAGPCSMLLKTHGAGRRVVCDPLRYPAWVNMRYALAGIEVMRGPGESLHQHFKEEIGSEAKPFDEVWIYNCLQHVEDPAQILQNALELGTIVRIFEWIDIPPHDGHPHMLTETYLNLWLGWSATGNPGGDITELSHAGCFGRAYSAVVVSGVRS